MMKVSIVIPTRNRAHLLRFALKSAVQQNYRDLEIVVCDNYSTDNTRAIVDSFDNQNIIYVRTDKALSLPDNWEFAFSKGSGEYITYLTDDSYLLPNSINTAMKELDKFNVKVAVWKHCAYFASDWLEPARRNLLYIPKVTSKSYLLNSRISLQKLYGNDEQISTLIPKSLNSLCHRSIIEKAMSVQNRFFLPPCPDYTSAASILLNTPEYLLIDQPLYIDGVTPSSIGATASFNLGESAQNFFKEFDQGLDDIAFIGIPNSTACIAKSLETVRNFYLNICPEINRKSLLCTIVDRLIKVEVNEGNVRNCWQILDEYIATQPRDIKLATAKQKVLSKLKWIIIKKIRSLPYLEYLEMFRGIYILKGGNWKFSNIEECAKIVAQRRGQKPDPRK